MAKSNPIHPADKRLTFFKDPQPRRRYGSLYADPEASPGIVYVFNPEAHREHIRPGIDEDIAESLKQIARAWRNKCIVMFGWLPNRNDWPLTTKLVIEKFGARGVALEDMDEEPGRPVAEEGRH